MNNPDTPLILKALEQLPHYASSMSHGFEFERLGGLTNRVYKVQPESLAPVVIRLAGDGTGDYIDRQVELHNARQAAIAGVSPEVLHADADEGLMITRLIPGVDTMTPALFAERDDAVERAGRALSTLHGSGVQFRFRFELFSMIDGYLDILSGKSIELPEGYHDIVRQAEPLKQALSVRPVTLAPCHCDPLCENFLDDGQQMWIVDWEYSGMNDPWWDLADLSVEGEFSGAQDQLLLQTYCKGVPAVYEVSRMIVYKAMCDLLWTLWGLIQHADGNPADDFLSYAMNRFERCQALMKSDAFKRASSSL